MIQNELGQTWKEIRAWRLPRDMCEKQATTRKSLEWHGVNKITRLDLLFYHAKSKRKVARKEH